MDAESQQVAELKAEIERLLTKAAKDENTLLVALDAATKEIERLKALISELCDALENGASRCVIIHLLQRAREATPINASHRH